MPILLEFPAGAKNRKKTGKKSLKNTRPGPKSF